MRDVRVMVRGILSALHPQSLWGPSFRRSVFFSIAFAWLNVQNVNTNFPLF